MSTFIIYHNPKCSKSRRTLEILENHQIKPTIIEYLKTPLMLEQLLDLKSHFDFKDFVRTDEPQFKQLGLTLNQETQILEAMVKTPILMQRPIVVCGKKAIIGRPPERALELIEDTASK